MPTIFLSHNHRDKPFVRELASYLKKYNITVWIDEAEIKIGESLTSKVGEAINENDFFGVVISNNSKDSEWVKRELQIATQREFKEKRVVVLPIVLDSIELPPFLSDKLYADFSTPDKFYGELGKVLNALGCSQKPGRRVYISYTYESPVHKDWVDRLYRKLVFDGVNATYDDSFMPQWTGDFWDAIVLELSRANTVILIGTQAYKQKVEGSIPGGLKREFDEILKQSKLRPDLKVVPVLRYGSWADSIPKQFATYFGIDMGFHPADIRPYQKLLATIG